MTKIFAISPNAKESDEKPKELEGITISSTSPPATFYPVTLPISSIVAKKRCGTSHMVIILLSLMTISFLFYMFPDVFYKRVHHLVSNEVTVSGSTSWAQQPGRYNVADENTYVMPKLDSSNAQEKMNRIMDQDGNMIQDNRDNHITGIQDGEIISKNDGDMKQSDDPISNRFEAMKAIATLLKIPGVQQVAVVQNNGRIPNNMMMKPEVVPDVPFVPQMEMKEWELMNYRRAMREWLLRREMFRRRMLAELERERDEVAERKMSQFVMGLQLQEQQEPPLLEQLQSILPMFPFARMHMTPPSMMWMNNIQSPVEANQRNIPVVSMISPPMIIPRIPPLYPYMVSRQQQQQPQQQQQSQEPQEPLQSQPQQQQSEIMPIKLMPQILSREEPMVQLIESNPGKPSTAPLQIRDDTINRVDLEQKKIPVPVVNQPIPSILDGTPDRDSIFKELRSRAQMQQQMSQQTVPPAVAIPPLLPSVVPPAQINSDEIFRELQHRALRMQIEQDRLEAEQRAEKEKNVETEIPVLMIADTFPRRPVEMMTEQTSEEIAGATVANIEATTMGSNSGNSPESLSTFFNFFDKGIHENEITNSPNKGQEITLKNDDAKVEPEHSVEEDTFGDVPVIANDGVRLIVKPDDTAPQVNFIQEPATSETPVSSEERHSDLFKSAVFQGESDDKNGGDMSGTRMRLLETSKIQ